MTRKVIILVAAPREEVTLSQVAALCLGLGKLNWRRWQPSLRLFSGDRRIEHIVRACWPHRGEVVPVSTRNSAWRRGVSIERESLFRSVPSGADVLVKMAPNTLAVSDFEDVLDQVGAARCVAGVIAHHSFAAWPGLPAQDAWGRLAEGLIEIPMEFGHVYPLLGTETPEIERRTPFYIDPGVVFFSASVFPEFAKCYHEIKPILVDRVPIAFFADRVAFSLAATKLGVSTVALPLRYNFPNNETAMALFPEELRDVRIFHYANTDDIGEDPFASEDKYTRFIESHLTGVNEILRTHVERTFGPEYTFRRIADYAQVTDSSGGNADSPIHECRSDLNDQKATPNSLAKVVSAVSVTGCRHFDYTNGRPNLYLLMRFKQALVAEFGVKRGFAIYQQTVVVADGDELLHKSLSSKCAFAATRSHGFFETAPGGESFVLEPPTVIGVGNHRPLAASTRSFYVACLGDARIRGRSAVIEADGLALLDYQDSERMQLDDEIEWDPAIFHASGETAWIVAPAADAASIELDTAFTLMGAHTDFFGHWLCEYLPKYIAASLSGILPSVPVLIDADMPETHRQALEFLYPGQLELIEILAFKTVRVARLWCAPALMYMPLHEKRNARFRWESVAAPPMRFAPIIREMAYRADLALGNPIGGTRVFLARREFRHRKLLNRANIEAVTAALGFEVIYPEELGFSEQVAALRNADFVIAPEGSALFLVFFARAGTKVCILCHPLTDVLADFASLLRPHGIEIIVLTGPLRRRHPQTPHDSDYEIHEGRFHKFIDRWLCGEP